MFFVACGVTAMSHTDYRMPHCEVIRGVCTVGASLLHGKIHAVASKPLCSCSVVWSWAEIVATAQHTPLVVNAPVRDMNHSCFVFKCMFSRFVVC